MDPPIIAPIPPQRSVWGIVLPIELIVGVVGFIVAMYVSGMRSFAWGFGILGGMMLVGMGGMLFRGRGAAQKMSWSQLEQYRPGYFALLDEVRDEVEVSRRQQWEHRAPSHWEPDQLVGVALSPLGCLSEPSDEQVTDLVPRTAHSRQRLFEALKRQSSRANGTKFGRPRKVYDSVHIATAKRMKADGHTAKDIARYLGVSRATLYRDLTALYRYLTEGGVA